MRLARPLASLALGACAALGAAAQEPAALRWLVQDVPPHFSYFNGRAPQKLSELGNGELDGFMRLIIPLIPQYQHEFVEAGLPRFEAMVKSGQTLCSTLHLRTPERLSWLYFTHMHPALMSRQVHLIIRREQAAAFESLGQPVQLAELLQRQDLNGLVPRDRSFGARIDAVLKTPGAHAPQTVSAGKNMHLLAMLRARRMDYTLEYPPAVDEFMRNSEAGPELLKLPLAEGRTTALATVACSRTPEGRRQIEAIDLAVRKLAQDPQREAWIRAWRGEHVDEADRQRLNRYMDERARGGPQIE
ncbi:TIGR02285 family protein [Paucibacter sp. APW11]|uniref:TIGR02285 family protein n=1 Tax=Roseateles aquae TaxID=3077235 RepID=A0ABU3PHY7_9BURK|nr:TIGR02285 family protein [Paucibacter sp. APW11]MDT9002045.1 TIGR02285 family protein [Paucibacter sp. APW11]